MRRCSAHPPVETPFCSRECLAPPRYRLTIGDTLPEARCFEKRKCVVYKGGSLWQRKFFLECL
ncbi:hypothetical protein [African swine fever virus]|uniref:Uncharacterized protein n=1 Tax=African swine fever virus TaxID=10497 RepID=A0A6G8EVP1_ASF|nr:hypothetical protein [African swine fever virus]QIM07007.1 hypothetical protein [African swine fever virus]QIM07242.1 hypothetical protein [African swine fever virus]QIM07477.1 hypothetical protein [African swine fever virus]QIM07710.1 hypothetical protein [African swine fever virus]